jgi:hypothetical protein
MRARQRWAFITFGAGLPNWRAAARRLESEAKNSGWFDVSVALTDRDLPRLFPQFVTRHENILNRRVRGYGYWIWKPFLIGELLNTLGNQYSGVVYMDAGCQLNPSGNEPRMRMSAYFDMAQSKGTFAMHLPDHREDRWSRRITMDYLNLDEGQQASPQIQATTVFVTKRSDLLVQQWLDACSAEDYAYLMDGPKVEVNAPGFVAHRHDQSIFSGLAKGYGIETTPDETFWAPQWSTAGRPYPIWAPRNRTRVRVEASGFANRTIRLAEKAYSRGLAETSRVASRLR